MNQTKQIEIGLGELESANQHLKHLGFEMISADRDHCVWDMDLFVMSSLHRAMCLNSGFCAMIKERNFICAAPLVRLQLDNLLRLSAAWRAKSADEFAHNFISGTEIRKMKDRNGKLMTDAHLVKELNAEYSWAQPLYDETSGYIHLSNKHLFNSIIAVDDDGLKMGAYPNDIAIPDSTRVKAIKAMFEINLALYQYINGWKETKSHRPDLIEADKQ